MVTKVVSQGVSTSTALHETDNNIKFNTVETTEEIDSIDVLLIDKDVDFPDGGLQAWLVVFGAFLGFIPAFGLLNSLGAIQAYIATNQLADVATSTVSWIFSIFSALTFASCIFAGCYFDRNGARLLLITGSVLVLGGVFGTANCTETWHFVLSFGLAAGTGCGILMSVLIACVATWFKAKRAIANSIASMGGSIGGICFPIMLRKLFTQVGFPWAIRILGFILTACLFGTCFLCRERVTPRSEPFASKKETVRFYLSRSFDYKYFADPKFLFMTLACSLAESTLITASTFFASYAIYMGNSAMTSYTLITIVNAAGVLGRVSGYIADRFVGNLSVLVITLILIAIINLTMWLPFGKHISVLYAYSVLYGFIDSSILSLTPVTVGQISEVKDFGKRYATMYVCVALLTLPVIPIGGAIIGDGSSTARYQWFIAYSSILSLLSAACYALTRYLCVGFKRVKF